MVKRFFLCLILLSIFTNNSAEDKKQIDIIKYGLDSEIITLIKDFDEELEENFSKELVLLLETSRSTELQETLINFFITHKSYDIKDIVINYLIDPLEHKKQLVISSLNYVGELEIAEARLYILSIIESGNKDFRDKAILVLRKIGKKEDVQFLLNLLDEDFDVDEKMELIIRQNIMQSIADIDAVKDIDDPDLFNRLKDISLDEDENTYIRSHALVALSKNKNIKNIEIIKKIFEEKDPVLRVASIKASAYYDTKDAEKLILEGFRDSYYKVRLETLEIAGNKKLESAIPFILYRAQHDPEEVVKNKALEILGVYNTKETKTFLTDIFLDEKKADKTRIKAASVLVLHNFEEFYSDFETVFYTYLNDDKKKYMRNELGKLISKIKNNKTISIARELIAHKDAEVIALGLDLYKINSYIELRSDIEKIANDERKGAISRRAKQLLEIDD